MVLGDNYKPGSQSLNLTDMQKSIDITPHTPPI